MWIYYFFCCCNSFCFIISTCSCQNKDVEKSESLFDVIENTKAEELKIPLIMGLLFIIFLLPAFQGIFKSFFSFAYDESEKLTNNGIYLQGLIFGLLALVVNKVA